jgi:thiol-disulfide isomerase/thioredoxin
MSMWYLTNSKQGGGLEMAINNEDFSVSCMDSIPTQANIVYKNTKENLFAGTNYQEQQAIFAKHDAMLYATRAYSKKEALYPVFEKEYNKALADYSEFVKKLKEVPLYSARFREIVNLTMGIGTIITQDENLKAKNINDFIVNQLDYGVLYTSNHWYGIINSFVQVQTQVFKDDKKLVDDARTILNRLPSDLIYTDFVTNLTRELNKAGRDNVLLALMGDIKTSNRLLNYNGVLELYKKDLSGKAPILVFADNTITKDGLPQVAKTIDFEKQKTEYSLVVFYQSGCGPCEATMDGLKEHYKALTDKGIQIFSVSADTDPKVFKETSSLHSWPNDYCDLQGFKGVNFKNYAAIGTPTIYLIDKKGAILSRIASTDALLIWMKENIAGFKL